MDNENTLIYKNNIAYYLIYVGAPLIIAFLCLVLIYNSFLLKQYEGAFFSFVFVVFSFKFLIEFKSYTWKFDRQTGLLEITKKNLLGKQVRHKSYELSKIETLYYANYTETSNNNIKRNHKDLFTVYLLIEGEEIKFFKPQSEHRTKQTANEISQLLNIPYEKGI